MKRKQFKAAVNTAMGRSKTKKSPGDAVKKAAKYARVINSSRVQARQNTTLRRLLSQKTRLARAIGKTTSPEKLSHIHVDAIRVYSDAAADGDEFAVQEKLSHIESLFNLDTAGEQDEHAEKSAVAVAQHRMKGAYVISLLSSSRVDDAKALLSQWTTSNSTELAFSKALIAYVAWRPERLDEGLEDPDEESLDNYELRPIAEEKEEGEDNETKISADEAEAMNTFMTALRCNRHVGSILKVLDSFTQELEPGTLADARMPDAKNYAGSIEEAFAYIYDAGHMWLDRPYLQDWVSQVLDRFDGKTEVVTPRSCSDSKKYKRLFAAKVLNDI